MITPRWRKVLADLWGSKGRTLLVALSIAVGVFAVGVVSSGYLVMSKDITADFLKANPHSALIFTSLLDDDQVAALKSVEGLDQLAGKSSVGAQVGLSDGQKVGISLYSIPALDKIAIDKIFLLQGQPTLNDKEVYIDRGSFAALGVKEGQPITIFLSDGRTRELRVVGVVHDAYTNAFSISRTVSAYVNADTLEWLGGTRLYSELVMTARDGPSTEAYVREVADRVADKIKKSGNEVYVTVAYKPGQHPVQSMIDAVLGMMAALGALSVFLSTFLVINTISALLNQQIRQIGVMKAVGADAWQVMGMYLVLILLFGIVALIFAVPLSGMIGYQLAAMVIDMLNSGLGPMRLPTEALVAMVVVGLGVPLLAGLWPVLSGARMTVRQAISNYGLSTGGSRGLFDIILENVRGLPRPLMISLRNTFRRKGRLALTLFTLMLGGAIFMGVFNVRDSLSEAIRQTFGYILSDVNVNFTHGYRIEQIRNVVAGMPGVETIEGWGGTTADVLKPNGQTADQVSFIAPPAGSQLIKPVMTAGRWLVKQDENAVVVGNHFIKLRPDVKVGDQIMVRLGKKDYPFRVVGIYQMAGTAIPPVLYTNAEYLGKIQGGGVGQVYVIRVLTDQHDLAYQRKIASQLEARFKQEGIGVSGIVTGNEIIVQQSVVINIIIALLLVMAVLIAMVGGLGLMGTMSMNVMERTREIGVMRSIGAVNSSIMQVVVVEGMIIGVISWALGALLSIPITNLLDNVLGNSLVNVPLAFTFSVEGLVIWVIVVIFLSGLACLLPARNAVRLTVRDVLAYE